MDILTIALIVVAVVALSGWGYGTYSRPVGPVGGPVVAGPGWVNPLGIVGLLVIVALVMMLVTGYRPFVVAP